MILAKPFCIPFTIYFSNRNAFKSRCCLQWNAQWNVIKTFVFIVCAVVAMNISSCKGITILKDYCNHWFYAEVNAVYQFKM